jgi:hypothetical protein
MSCHKESALVLAIEFGVGETARGQDVEVIGLGGRDDVVEIDLVVGR